MPSDRSACTDHVNFTRNKKVVAKDASVSTTSTSRELLINALE